MFHCTKGSGGSAKHRLALARKASFALQQKCVRLGLHNPATLCKLFKAMVMPILFYGAQVAFPFWDQGQVGEADRLFKRFLKSVLGVPANLPDYFVYGEVAEHPISVHAQAWVFRFWNKVWSEGHQSHLSRLVVEEDFASRGETGRRSSWAAKSMKLFQRLGLDLGDLEDHCIPEAGTQIWALKRRYREEWELEGEGESSYHQFYRLVKPSWGIDKSLHISDKELRIVLARFRSGCYLLNSGPGITTREGWGIVVVRAVAVPLKIWSISSSIVLDMSKNV